MSVYRSSGPKVRCGCNQISSSEVWDEWLNTQIGKWIPHDEHVSCLRFALQIMTQPEQPLTSDVPLARGFFWLGYRCWNWVANQLGSSTYLTTTNCSCTTKIERTSTMWLQLSMEILLLRVRWRGTFQRCGRLPSVIFTAYIPNYSTLVIAMVSCLEVSYREVLQLVMAVALLAVWAAGKQSGTLPWTRRWWNLRRLTVAKEWCLQPTSRWTNSDEQLLDKMPLRQNCKSSLSGKLLDLTPKVSSKK